jgi:hypothetical protein
MLFLEIALKYLCIPFLNLAEEYILLLELPMKYCTSDEERHIKLTARLYDQCQDTFTQLGQFLTTNPTNNQSLKTLPSFEELSTMYHLQADSAFFLLRTKLSDQVLSFQHLFLGVRILSISS